MPSRDFDQGCWAKVLHCVGTNRGQPPDAVAFSDKGGQKKAPQGLAYEALFGEFKLASVGGQPPLAGKKVSL